MSERPRLALVVDDSPPMRRQLVLALHRMGIQAVEATDGADGWRKLQQASFDLVCTDINMPRMDGLKLLGLIRAGGAHQRTPVVVISTESAEPDRRRAMALGASAYLVKPVQGLQVSAAVRSLLGLPASARTPGAG